MPMRLDPAGEELDVFFGIINRFIGYFTVESQRESHNDSAREYPFVPMDTRQMFRQLQVARNHLRSMGKELAPPSFIDIGCGIGNVLLVAEQMDFAVFGIEKDTHPFTVASRLLGADKVVQVDIWNFKNYGDFEVIYYFRPFHDGASQREFEHTIEEALKVTGILIANRKMSGRIETDSRFQRLESDLPVWQKIRA